MMHKTKLILPQFIHVVWIFCGPEGFGFSAIFIRYCMQRSPAQLSSINHTQHAK